MFRYEVRLRDKFRERWKELENGGFEVDDIVASTSGEEEMATYSIFRHTTWRTHAMISRYIGNWGCCACTCWPFPLLRSRPSPACARGKPLRNLQRGGFGRGLLAGFVVRVGLPTFSSLCTRPFIQLSNPLPLSNHSPLAFDSQLLIRSHQSDAACNFL